MITDLNLISGEFFEYEIPKEKRFLLKYFKTDLQMAFLRYYMLYETPMNFVDHTGHYCSKRMLFIFAARYKHLIKLYEQAKSDLSEESMHLIYLLESGQYKIPKGSC
jgi:hypothetical protein